MVYDVRIAKGASTIEKTSPEKAATGKHREVVVFAGLDKVLRRLRGKRTLREVAAGAGIAREHLTLLEYKPAGKFRGRELPERRGMRPRLGTLDALLRYYRVTLSELERLLAEEL
jgi:hypothetical protein